MVHSFDGTWYVMDLGSRYGTLLNGTKIEPKKYVPLQEGALLRLGAHRATMAPSYYGSYDTELLWLCLQGLILYRGLPGAPRAPL